MKENLFDYHNIGSSKPEMVRDNVRLDLGLLRVNHLLIKEKGKSSLDKTTLNKLPIGLNNILQYSFAYAWSKIYDNLGSVLDKYCYLTIDQGLVKAGQTLREPGWHIDGFQGAEVPSKKPIDYNFIWSDALPMEYYKIPMSQRLLRGFDENKDNIFNLINKEVSGRDIYTISQLQANNLYLIDSYTIHRAQVATQDTYRRFVRVSFTEVPITSVKMTVNPYIKYNYPIHTTSGNIPSHLI